MSDVDRLLAYDMARAIAVVGMILVNCHSIFLPYGSRVGWGGQAGYALYGRPAALFVMLAGVGLVMLSRRAAAACDCRRISEIRLALVRRSVALFVIGMAFSLVWKADILHFYSMWLVIGAVLLQASRRLLCLLVFAVLLIFTIVYIQSEGEPSMGSYVFDPGPLAVLLDDLLSEGDYAAFPWIAFLLTGMWIGKCDNGTEPAYWKPTLIGGSMIAAAAEIMQIWAVDAPLGFVGQDSWDLLMRSDSFPATPLFAISAIAGGAALITGLRVVIPNNPSARWVSPVCSTGKLSMTIYMAHILIATGAERSIGYAKGSEAYRNAAFTATFLICLISIGFAHWWLKHHRRGPLEQVFRWGSAS